MSSPLDDFAPDREGLTSALDALIDHRSATGDPHPEPVSLPPSWPADGIGGRGALDALIELALIRPARLDHPGFLAHMDPPTPWFTWAAVQWAAATNQNLLQPDVAPQMRELETTVVDWLAPSLGMNGGHLVPGSTIANLTALWAARELRPIAEVVTSDVAHLSVAKAAHVLGLPLRTVATRADQSIDVDAIGDVTSSALVLTAGGTTAGAIDDLALAHAHVDRAAWVHVDAAWAGPLRFSPTHATMLTGIEHADSVALSAHKWLHQPKDCAGVFFADTDEAHRAVSFGGAYLPTPNLGLLGSSGARALPLAATLLAWGRSGVARVVEAGMDRITELRDLAEGDPDVELFPPHLDRHTGVLLWRPTHADVRETQTRLRNAWVSVTEVDGTPWFRSVGANPLADPAGVLDAVRTAAAAARSLP